LDEGKFKTHEEIKKGTSRSPSIDQNILPPEREINTNITNVLRQKSLYFVCHSGLDPESSASELDSRFRGNDGFGNNVKKY